MQNTLAENIFKPNKSVENCCKQVHKQMYMNGSTLNLLPVVDIDLFGRYEVVPSCPTGPPLRNAKYTCRKYFQTKQVSGELLQTSPQADVHERQHPKLAASGGY